MTNTAARNALSLLSKLYFGSWPASASPQLCAELGDAVQALQQELEGEPAQAYTIIVWNNEKIITRYAHTEAGRDEMVELLREELHKDDDDPRWQWVDGVLHAEHRGLEG